MSTSESSPGRWYTGVTRYQWLVLIIASLGWVFDVFEGQIFVASMNEAMPSLAPDADSGTLALYNNITLAAFLLGGAIGGVAFGILSDRIGRKRAMTWTILMYSAFTFISAFSLQWWHMAAFRFLVAMGVGGEWAVASAMVAEVFPKRARAWSLGIFHASSVFGTLLAIAAGAFIIGNEALQSETYPSLPWRVGFALGVLPALLIIWIRMSLREPEQWQAQRDKAQLDPTQRMGRFVELFSPQLVRHTIIGVGLAAIGLATFWGAHIYGKDVLRNAVQAAAIANPDSGWLETMNLKRWEMVGMLLVTIGGGVGLVSFGPLCEAIGRRGAFLLFHLFGLGAALLLFQYLADQSPNVILLFLPLFGFLTLGMHAGYAIYFPELFPTRLRGTGGGFCFNIGRIMAAPCLFAAGWLQLEDKGAFFNRLLEATGVSPGAVTFGFLDAVSILSGLYLLGVVLLLFAPETKGQELPE